MVQHARLYKMMLKCAALGGINIHTTLDMAWNTGSLSHALCASPMDPLFMETLLEHNIESDGVQFWTAGMGESQKVRVELCLLVCPTISSVNSHSNAHAIKAQKTNDEIKSVVSMQGHTVFSFNTFSYEVVFCINMLTSFMKYEFFVSSIVDLLSTIIITFSSFECVSLLSSPFNHNTCVVAAVAAMNSNSHDDSATVACFCVLQLIGD
nr:hypothetical protein [Tanacetum cinerariifolium]